MRGPAEARQSLASFCRGSKEMGIAANSVFVPQLNELVDATTESHIYQVQNLSIFGHIGSFVCKTFL